MGTAGREGPDRHRRRRPVTPADTLTLHPESGASPDGGSESLAGFAFRRGVCVGRYVVLQAIGSGGMGNVYAAYDPELDRRVALKVLRADLLTSEQREEAHQRLLREAQATARLSHPNVVVVYDTGTVGERLFLAMELVEGMSLTEWLAAAPRTWREILAMFNQAGRGLAAAHRVGLVHRDFKPGNVMVGDDGRARVVDFGLARAAIRSSEPPPDGGAAEPASTAASHAPDKVWSGALTVAGKALGTPTYMAPEQGAGGVTDARADQFSFCLALYEALYGELPFGRGDAGGPARDPESSEARPAPADPSIPAWLRRVVLRGLSRDPAARFASIEDLLEALAADPAARRRRWLVGAVAGVAAGLALGGFAYIERRTESLCTGAERKLAGVWDAPRQAELRQAFLATGVGYAADTWRRVATSLDAYATSWVDLKVESCEATRRRGEQSEDMLDRQVACLDSRLQELEALSRLFSRADGQVVENAILATDRLGRLRACSDLRALLSGVEPPGDPETEARVKQLRERLAEAKVLGTVGKYSQQLKILEQVVPAVDELGYRPMIAEARLEFGRVQGRMRDIAAMKSNLLTAAREALAVSHDEVLAQALNLLIVADRLLGRTEQARDVAELAAGAVEGLVDRPIREAQRRFYLGGVALTEKRYQEGLDHYRAASAGGELDGFDLAALLSNSGEAYVKLGRLDEALAASREALRLLEDEFGADHRHVMSPLLNLGELLIKKGDVASALPFFERARSVVEGSGGAHYPDVAYGLTGAARCLIELNRAGEAVPLLERAVQIRVDAALDPALLAASRFQLAQALAMSGGDSRRARGLAEQALRSFAELGERTAQDRERVAAWLRDRSRTP